MLDVCLISEGGGLLGGGMRKSFVYAHVNKLGVSEGSVGGILVAITGGETDVTAMYQEDMMCNGKEPLKLRGGEDVAATIMEF